MREVLHRPGEDPVRTCVGDPAREALTSFAQVEADLLAWINDRARMTGDGPKALFSGAVGWLREHNALLPGRHHLGTVNGWSPTATSQLTGGEARVLLGLYTREENRRRYVELERLRKGTFTPSPTGITNVLARVWDVNAVVPASVDITAVPARGVIALTAQGSTCSIELRPTQSN
ncbi:hypothetical protein ACFROC_07000 [Nocardia tengchongensis]|uniref:hypothetical protein n=1 Tax=Nocardia tengchongensis TaxID=2055889 RepID=UPI0036938622